jgi:hypothetical protein
VICFCFLWLPVTFRGARTSEPRNLGTSELSQQSSDSFVLDDATTRTSARGGALGVDVTWMLNHKTTVTVRVP